MFKPSIFNIIITNVCYLNCFFCLKHNKKITPEVMHLSTFKMIIKNLERFGIKYIELTPTIGDICTLSEDVLQKYFKVLDESSIDSYFFYTSLATKKPFSKEFINSLSDKCHIYVSLYGVNEEQFNTNTASKNYFYTVIENLKNIFNKNSVILLRADTNDTTFDIRLNILLKMYGKERVIEDSKTFSVFSENENTEECYFKYTDNGVDAQGNIIMCSWIDENKKEILGHISNLSDIYKNYESKKSSICKHCGFFKTYNKNFRDEFIKDFLWVK